MIFYNDYNNVLLVSEDYIKSVTNLNDNVCGDYLLPSIQIAQTVELEETIGTPLVNKLQELVATGDIKLEEYKPYKYLLDNYLQPFLAYAALSHIVMPISFKLTNSGVMRTADEKMNYSSADESDKVKAYYKKLADTYQYRLQRFLIGNYNLYPELLKYRSIADLRANLYSAASCNLFLGGARGKYINNPSMFFGYGLPNSTIEIR